MAMTTVAYKSSSVASRSRLYVVLALAFAGVLVFVAAMLLARPWFSYPAHEWIVGSGLVLASACELAALAWLIRGAKR